MRCPRLFAQESECLCIRQTCSKLHAAVPRLWSCLTTALSSRAGRGLLKPVVAPTILQRNSIEYGIMHEKDTFCNLFSEVHQMSHTKYSCCRAVSTTIKCMVHNAFVALVQLSIYSGNRRGRDHPIGQLGSVKLSLEPPQILSTATMN